MIFDENHFFALKNCEFEFSISIVDGEETYKFHSVYQFLVAANCFLHSDWHRFTQAILINDCDKLQQINSEIFNYSEEKWLKNIAFFLKRANSAKILQNPILKTLYIENNSSNFYYTSSDLLYGITEEKGLNLLGESLKNLI